MIKLAHFDPRKRPRRDPSSEAFLPGVHDDFKPTQPAVLSVEAPRRNALPHQAPRHAGADMPSPDAQTVAARGAQR